MQRALQLAAIGVGTTRPNPSVGAVIVHDNLIIGEGFTSPYGGPHAEVNAINSVTDKTCFKQASLYVTLEPCSHYGKTPPCSDLIIKHGIQNVFIGTIDSNSKVSGAGIEKLEASGTHVSVGILKEKCIQHHKRFLTFHNKKRPYIILKWAESKDGFIAPVSKKKNKPVWLTNSFSRQLVHKWRTEEHAILVGTNTVLSDDPSLTARDYKGQNPIRVVIDRKNKLENTFQILDNTAKTIIVSEDCADFSKPLGKQICEILHNHNIQSVIIEGGAKTIQTFINENLWDEARIFTGSSLLGDGLSAPKLSGLLMEESRIRQDRLSIFRNIE